MDFIKTFTKKNIARNKKRTVVTIIGVMLSAALICTVAGMMASFVKSMQMSVIEQQGSYHAQFLDVPADQLNLIEDNVHVVKSGTIRELGYARLPKVEYKSLPYARVLALDKAATEIISVDITEGRLPENDSELLISERMNKLGKMDLKLGDTLTLVLGKLDYDGDEERYIPVIKDEKVEKTYTIVGMAKDMGGNKEFDGVPAFTAVTLDERNGVAAAGDKVDVFAVFDKPKYTGDYAEKIFDTYQKLADEGKTEEIGGYSKSELARFQGSIGSDLMRTLIRIVAVVIFVIVITSVFVISNSFRISVSEKVGQYGMLASIGATRKQIKRTVLREGLYIGVIGTISGIVLAIGVMFILCTIINYLALDIVNVKMHFAFPMWVAVVTVIMSAVTVYLSCVLPAASAAKISPIEAIRGNWEVGGNLNSRKLRTGKLVKKIFGIGGVIASKNLKRSRRKYRTTVISLVLGIATFVGLSSFIDLGYGLVRTEYMEVNYDIMVRMSYNELSPMSKDGRETIARCYEKLKGLPDVERVYCYHEAVLQADPEKYASDERKTYLSYGDDMMYTKLVIMPPDDFREFAQSVGIKSNEPASQVILSDKYTTVENGKFKEFRVSRLNAGDTISGVIENYDDDGHYLEDGGISRSFKVTAVTGSVPIGYEGFMEQGGYLIVSEDYFDELPPTMPSGAFVIAKDAKAAAAQISELTVSDNDMSGIYYKSIAEEADQMKRLLMLVSIFLYGFVTVIVLIGVTNVINTITTNMNLRAREFAMLKSVGMSGKEFNRMIRLESVMYGSKSLIFGLPIGVVISYLLNRAFGGRYEVVYTLPVKSALISILFVALIVGFTMRYSLAKINRQNMIETIRKHTL
ncbi:MAG: ABC transporter permease [Lachnospiraceae bacterium]|nr:ABC transporter permease [Lachnospiraceae bacterium]